MKNIKSHFWYSSQRNGILFLALFIIILQLVYFFGNFSKGAETALDGDKAALFQQKIDSLKAVELEINKPKTYPFNPSFITDFKGYQLGMSTEEIDRLLHYRAEGKYINSTEEFQQVTKVSDSLLNRISPFFKFPDWITQQKQSQPIGLTNATDSYEISYTKKDINSATSQDLIRVRGIGNKLATRIINYRNKLGGFLINEQLFEVYYLDSTVANSVLTQFSVLKKPSIKKINVNEASFKELLSIVYIDYDLTKKILDYKDEVAEIQSLEELKKIDGFPLDKFDRISLYLQAN
tara:strand:+ start:129975 stop:130853 length:879 start_codon:yes stop_codon:yes gene_type:complete